MSENKINILHIDDNKEYLELTKIMLESKEESYQVYAACSAKTAMKMLKSGIERDFHMILLDYELQENENGLDLLKDFKKEDIKIPIIFLTNNNDITLKENAFQLGVSEFIYKVTLMRDNTYLYKAIRKNLVYCN
jgi:DNA-binding NtrC family response regulator